MNPKDVTVDELADKLDEWVRTVGRHHGEDVPWEEIDDLFRDTHDYLAKIRGEGKE